MKLVLAIFFSLMLGGTPFLSASTVSCAKPTPRTCCRGDAKMACCDAKSDSHSVPMVPVQNPPLNPSLATTAIVLWVLPESSTDVIPAAVVSSSDAAPLYTRHCALLL